LYGTSHPSKPCPPAPSWTVNDLHSEAFQAFTRACGPTAVQGLFPRADAAWHQHPDKSCGTAHYDMLPSHWAERTFGSNLIRALSGHLLRALNDIRAHHLPSTTLTRTACIMPPFPTRYRTSLAVTDDDTPFAHSLMRRSSSIR
jgi:hypothetical protein